MSTTLDSKIFVAGHQGMVGSAIVRRLLSLGYQNIITRSRQQLDLLNKYAVDEFLQAEKIEVIYLAAAKVGGIYANNTYPAAFIYENLMIAANLIHAAHQHNINELLFLGSSCIYPKLANQPISEEALLTGALEITNEPYAVAKIAGIKLCESYNRQYGRDYRSVMPTNLYGPNDNFHAQNSHVVPALMRRFHDAVSSHNSAVTIWGSGMPRREFLHVDDLAAACVYVRELDQAHYEQQVMVAHNGHLNVGTGQDCSIKELAELLATITGFQGTLHFDTTKPDGTLRKLLDVTRLNSLGWRAQISLEVGLSNTYNWYKLAQNSMRM